MKSEVIMKWNNDQYDIDKGNIKKQGNQIFLSFRYIKFDERNFFPTKSICGIWGSKALQN